MEATLQSIFRDNFAHYQAHHSLSRDQTQAAYAIMNCQQPELGHETWICPQDGHLEHQAHSCRHRSCPRCQRARTAAWLDRTQARLLPCDHYHVVFTLPHELNEVWQFNRQWSADHLFKAAAETLRQLLKDDRYLGADVGLLAALHTWGRTASFHPHVHVLVTGGGLQGEQWRPVKKDFLLPVGVLKAIFRGKWLDWLNRAYSQGDIQLPGHWSHRDWQRALYRVARKNWNVRIQGPYRHGEGVVNYLSRYLHGGPIKDHRLIEADAEQVRFCYRDHHDGQEKTMSLKTEHFISRVLWHVPAKGQHNLRYYGLYVPGATARRDTARLQLPEARENSIKPNEKPPRKCPDCGAQMWHYYSTRRQISYIKSHCPPESAEAAQQGVKLSREIAQWMPP